MLKKKKKTCKFRYLTSNSIHSDCWRVGGVSWLKSKLGRSFRNVSKLWWSFSIDVKCGLVQVLNTPHCVGHSQCVLQLYSVRVVNTSASLRRPYGKSCSGSSHCLVYELDKTRQYCTRWENKEFFALEPAVKQRYKALFNIMLEQTFTASSSQRADFGHVKCCANHILGIQFAPCSKIEHRLVCLETRVWSRWCHVIRWDQIFPICKLFDGRVPWGRVVEATADVGGVWLGDRTLCLHNYAMVERAL